MRLKYILLLMVLVLSSSLYAQKVREVKLKLRNQPEPVSYLVSDIDSITFSKSENLPHGPYSVSVSNVTAVSAVVNVVPDNDAEPYYFDIMSKADYEAAGGDLSSVMNEFIQYLESIYGLSSSEVASMLQSHGQDSDTFDGLTPDTEYYAFAVGLSDDGTVGTDASVISFRTSRGGDPAQCTFDISTGYVGTTYALINVVPSDATVPYYCGVVPASEYTSDADLVAANQAELKDMAESFGYDIASVVKAVAMYGENEMDEDGLQLGTEYVAYAYAIGSDGGATGTVYTRRFTTAASESSNVKIDISCPKYFDGDALSAYNPEKYSRYAGYVVVPAYVTVDDVNAMHWYVGLTAGDASDPAMYPDETVIYALVDNGAGVVDKKEVTFIANWGTATFLGVAQDHSGIFGDVDRLTMTFDKAGAAPAEEFEAAQQAASAQFRMKGMKRAPKHLYEMLRDKKSVK